MTKRGRPKMSAQWLQKLKQKRADLARIAEQQPRRGAESAGERLPASSSSSSEESSDSEDLYDYAPNAVHDERPAVCDAVLREMAVVREKRRAARRAPPRGRGPGAKRRSWRGGRAEKTKPLPGPRAEASRKAANLDGTAPSHQSRPSRPSRPRRRSARAMSKWSPRESLRVVTRVDC